MNLSEKSDENMGLVENCLRKDKFMNAVVSRVYYAVFQKMKHYLIENEFDYGEFKHEINAENQDDFSHGTIYMATRQCYIMKHRDFNFDTLSVFDRVSNLYKARITADYKEDIDYDRRSVTRFCDSAKSIMQLLD
ncbi:MAG: hypothetical protein KKD38_00430 [Candidatus Delongbacteria bacterium]|nr:hypothetical protein [Candidatus Delongbacteria bacterium]MCG2761354.1 hypothetical protein [Candidatus Delongbacteria bacterium]